MRGEQPREAGVDRRRLGGRGDQPASSATANDEPSGARTGEATSLPFDGDHPVPSDALAAQEADAQQSAPVDLGPQRQIDEEDREREDGEGEDADGADRRTAAAQGQPSERTEPGRGA